MYSVRFEKPWRRILQLQGEVSGAQHRELVSGGRDGENGVTLKKQSNLERKNIRKWGVHRRRLSALGSRSHKTIYGNQLAISLIVLESRLLALKNY